MILQEVRIEKNSIKEVHPPKIKKQESKNFLALINAYTHSQTKSNHDFISRHTALKLQKSIKKIISWATRKKKEDSYTDIQTVF